MNTWISHGYMGADGWFEINGSEFIMDKWIYHDPFVDGIVDEKTSTNREPPHLWKHPYREKKHIMKRRLSACFEYAGDFKIVYDAVGNGFGTTFNTGTRRTVQRFQC